MENSELIKLAKKARENSYSPYSKFKVGVALLTKTRKVFYGTNVENCSYGACNCAERTALFSAIANGEKEFQKMAIIGDENQVIYPCGICRQVIAELAPNIEIICSKNEKEYEVSRIDDLLPKGFTPNSLK